MKRSLKKGPYIAAHLFKKIEKLNIEKRKEAVKTWSRASTILPSMIGHTVCVYNGRKHIPIYISDQLVGHKLGEFSFTRNFKTHKKAERKIKK